MLLAKIQSDLTQALKQRALGEVSTLRLLLSEIHNKKIERQTELTDEEVIDIIQKEIKKRKEAIEAYKQGKRDDLAEKEEMEAKILSSYLPQPLSPGQLEKIITQTIAEIGARGEKDLGRMMGAVMERVKGRAEGAEVARLVREQLVKMTN